MVGNVLHIFIIQAHVMLSLSPLLESMKNIHSVYNYIMSCLLFLFYIYFYSTNNYSTSHINICYYSLKCMKSS